MLACVQKKHEKYIYSTHNILLRPKTKTTLPCMDIKSAQFKFYKKSHTKPKY